jgi:ATP-dependent DNA helicase RecG
LRCFETGENGWQTRGQNGIVPHLLVLSATPIPRTLALTLYGDLDLVTLDELPPGRKPVITRVCADASARVLAYAAVKEAVAAGGQAFVVCPAINEHSGTLRPPTAVKSLARALRAKLAPARMGVLHGQLSGDEQQATIEAFHAGALDVLVATTVLEVGVDVPRASVMVIEDADRFGLAQLHQLRGRVGRGHEQAYCFLLTGATEVEALERLEVLATVHDGFRIAEEDLRRRGAGDLRGTRQTGVPELRFADLASYAGLVELAHEAADQIVAIDPGLSQPEHRELRRAVVKRWQQARPIAEEAG